MGKERAFSERTYAVPFGRYQPGGDVGPPDNEVLVGREGQRAYLIDQLFRMGRRGAFLVTGHRGSGKTSFVHHCLRVHRDEVFERFLNSNVGRATFWDRLGVLVLGFVVLVALAMTSQLIEVLTRPWGMEPPQPLSPLVWILLAPLVLICSFPMLFAGEVLREVRKAAAVERRPRIIFGIKALLCIALSLLLLHPLWGRGIERLPFCGPSGDERPQLCAAGAPLLSSAGEELALIAVLFVVLLAVFHFEYAYVVRPFLRRRLGQAESPDSQKPTRQQIDGCQRLARLTLPWILLKAWLPVLTVSVNLGFEKLDHRRVIHAMLAGLREEYRQAFLSWSSGFANLVRILGFLVLLALTHFIGDHWFELPGGLDVVEPPRESSSTRTEATRGTEVTTTVTTLVPAPPKLYENLCHSFERAQVGPAAANVVCKLPGGDTFLKILYYNLLQGLPGHEKEAGEDHLLFELLLPFRADPWPNAEAPFLESGVHFNLYHLLIFGVLYISGRWLLRRLPILPYEEMVRRIDEVMDFLSARTSVTSRTNRWEPVQVFQGWLIDERTRQIDQDPADPRTVEFLFLQILNDIQKTAFRLGGRQNQLVHLPTPEITFFFDELDKLGTRVDPGEKESTGGAQQEAILHAERKRSLELHSLLADMKNLLSSAPARFLFVGGRNLHDEWLADQGSRQPLLTNIFNAEVYLPSLLTDFGWDDKDKKALDLNIDLYLRKQCSRAEQVHRSRNKERLPFYSLPIENDNTELFTADKVDTPDDSLLKPLCTVCGHGMGETHATRFNRDFRQFLTYRSMGNPKRLKELLGSFVRPAGRLVKRPASGVFPCDHVLAFGDTERFRIQLLARIYRHLTQSLDRRLANRDDKLAISLFHLSDFLFKFHRRAFSWSNLERVDELAHIHRAPDLREILESLVGQWTERFLHPIRNGMYDFRFRSDLAREVEYISRQSPSEMAAFNFTLDESQALKSAYTTNLAYLKERTGREPIDMVAGLGELHEFDQEYEDARVYYWRAIALLDERIQEIAGEPASNPAEDADRSAVLASFMASDLGRQLSRHFLTWGISRLRLMLQIGMTFELTRNFERASIEYRNASTLARALRQAMASDPAVSENTDGTAYEGTLHPLKHLNILFQPTFAEAWIAEKLASAVETSISLIEKELWELRGQLPFASDLQAQVATNPVAGKASNFALILAELHDKAADLYFFKGRQRVTLDDLKRMTDEELQGLEGYLLRAHYHYAVALHEMRRLVSYRRASSRNKLGIPFEDGPGWPTIKEQNWPDFLYRSAGGALNDLAEATLGRISLYGLLRKLLTDGNATATQEGIKLARQSIVTAFLKWMESQNPDDIRFMLPHQAPNQPLASWLGTWSGKPYVPPGSPYFPLVHFKQEDYKDDFTRLIGALQLKMAGSKILERGGYIEGAAHELLGVCEIVTSYLWWILSVRRLFEWFSANGKTALPEPLRLIESVVQQQKEPAPWQSYLANFALYSLKKASQLFQLGRRAEKEAPSSYLIGNQIPVAQLLLTCSLALARTHWEPNPSLRAELALLEEWGVLPGARGQNQPWSRDGLSTFLKDALIRHSYPMVNRLQGLKVLIDDSLLSETSSSDEAVADWIDELQKLTAELDAPMHFTPLHSGATYALAYCRWLTQQRKKDAELKKIRLAAQRDLQTSEEMFTLRRAYYENISDLTYLYDDFNDRQLHLSRGIQMAGAEINALFLYLVTADLREAAQDDRLT